MTTSQTPTSQDLYISAITQKIHTTRTCSVTRRNHAVNLATSTSAADLRAMGYSGCRRCGADQVLAQATSHLINPT